MKKIIAVLVLLAVLVAGGIYYFNRLLNEKQIYLAGEKLIIIGFSMGATREERWTKDRELFVKRAQELGAEVSVVSSDYNIEREILQIESLISQGVGAIVVMPSNSETIWPAIEKAKQAGIKVISYDRLIKDSDIDLYISFDNFMAGQLQAESILSVIDHGRLAYIGGSPADNNSYLLRDGTMDALASGIDSGKIELVVDKFTDDWKPEEAYKTMKEYLDSGQTVDAVIAANDGIASGVIQALKEKGLDGKVLVSGQDADLSAVQRIVAGTQFSTVYKPISSLAYKAAESAVALVKGDAMEVTNVVDNGMIKVPSYFFKPSMVSKKNIMGTVVKDGFYTYDEVYKSVKQ
ncbi:MAG: substrate-binding domain-containing protein [Patescibacteria group bacterium]|jgi:D-xylose transport system substrate-binding protein